MKTFVVLTAVAVFSFISSANADNRVKMSAASNENYEVVPALEMTAAFAPVAEATLEVENWMTNENFFAPLVVAETEQPLEVQNWMTNSETFMETTFTRESDHALQVESWMTNSENFAPVAFTGEREKALEVEAWMLDQTAWNL